MSLTNLLNNKQLKKFKKELPKVFPVWKAMFKNGECEFQSTNHNEQDLKRKGIYFARNCPKSRLGIPYKPGFHVFLTKKEAEKYGIDMEIIEFRARQTWVTGVGKTTYQHIQSIVISRIEVI